MCQLSGHYKHRLVTIAAKRLSRNQQPQLGELHKKREEEEEEENQTKQTMTIIEHFHTLSLKRT